MIKRTLFLIFLALNLSLKGQNVVLPLMKDTVLNYKGGTVKSLYFITDISQNAFLKQWMSFIKVKFDTKIKSDFRNKTNKFFVSEALNHPQFEISNGLNLHVGFIELNKDSTLWVLFLLSPNKEVNIISEGDLYKKWMGIGNTFLVEKLPVLYKLEFDVLKRDVHFLEKELDKYRNKLVSNRKLILKLEKENLSLEGLIREEEDSLREMLNRLSEKIKKWEKVKPVP